MLRENNRHYVRVGYITFLVFIVCLNTFFDKLVVIFGVISHIRLKYREYATVALNSCASFAYK